MSVAEISIGVTWAPGSVVEISIGVTWAPVSVVEIAKGVTWAPVSDVAEMENDGVIEVFSAEMPAALPGGHVPSVV